MKNFLENVNLRKWLGIVAIVCFSLAALIGLALLFSIITIDSGNSIVVKILLTLLIIFCASIFIMNALEALVKKNIVGYATVLMILVAALLFLIVVWILNSVSLWFVDVLAIVTAITLFLDLFIGNYILVGKKLLGLQIPFYTLFVYFEFAIVFAIFGNNVLLQGTMLTIFIAVCIVGVTLFIILLVLRKNYKKIEEPKVESTDEIKSLKKEIERLKSILKENNIKY